MVIEKCPNCKSEFHADSVFEIISEDIPKEIFRRIWNIGTDRINSLYICSPFMSPFKGTRQDPDEGRKFFDTLQKIGKNLTSSEQFVIVTRQKADYSDHRPTVDSYFQHCAARVYFRKDLHTKLYLIGADSLSFAVFGSPNLTHKARTNVEMGVFVTDLDEYNKFERAWWQMIRDKQTKEFRGRDQQGNDIITQ